ncbi:MAG: NAD(+) diphosphatase [Clostridiales bacterium]|nr:NAD(+) diphosphatase [Clostridiales bacterium]MCI6435608.1 NAD(+) diphosphatase [Clostridiales bacterium]
MIQDIFPHVLHNQYDPAAKPQADDWVLCFQGQNLLLGPQDRFPMVKELGAEGCTYLFSVDEERYFLKNDIHTIPAGFALADVKQLRREQRISKHRIFAALTGKHLADWYRDTRFCGRCGAEMVHSPTERARKCPACGYTAYPRIMPAVIVGVKNGDKLLITRYREGFSHNALIAGFTEIGETAEQTVAREVMEEAGVRVKNIRYYASQPWGIANDLLMGFFCELDGDGTIHMDENELKYAQWVSREEIELQPDDFSLTNEMMTRFKTGAEQ